MLSTALDNHHLTATPRVGAMEHMKPVLFVVDSYFPAMGGAEQQALALAKALSEQGVKVEFVAPHLEKDDPLHDNIEGFKLTRISYPHIKFLGAILLMLSFSLFIIKNRSRYAYVHVHITKLLATSLGITKPLHGLKVISKISGHAEFTGGFLDLSKKYNIANMIMRFFIKKLDYIQTISDYTRTVLKDNGFSDKQIKCIPNSVKLSNYAKPDYHKEGHQLIRIGFCGRIEKVKGLELLFQAYKNLPSDLSETVEILIAGEGTHLDFLKQYVNDLGIADKVKFYGFLTNVPKFLKTVDIYVQPSYAEGLSNSVLEAMSAALPVVASRISGNVDLIVNNINGLLFSSGNIDELTQQLAQLIDNPNHRKVMGDKGRTKIKQGYSAQSVSEKLIELYFNE